MYIIYTKIYKFLQWFFIGVQLFLGICGALTLAIGCLGVANIMFLIVTERTREIGVKMAVGASTWHIILQIMLEALIIVGLGGAIGFFIAPPAEQQAWILLMPWDLNEVKNT